MAEETQQADWRAALPDELKTDPTVSKFKTPADLAKGYIEASKLIGGSVRVPSKDAGPEARKAFIGTLMEKVPELLYLPDDEAVRADAEVAAWKKLGKPDDEKGYSLDGLELPEGVKLADDQLRATAKALGLTKGQFKAFAAAHAGELAAASQAEKAALASLRADWGEAYEERTLSAKAAALKMGVPETALATMPAAQLKVWANVAKGVGAEARQVGDQGGGSPGKLTPGEAAAQRSEIMARPEYFNPKAAQMAVHENLKRKVQELNAIIHPL